MNTKYCRYLCTNRSNFYYKVLFGDLYHLSATQSTSGHNYPSTIFIDFDLRISYLLLKHFLRHATEHSWHTKIACRNLLPVHHLHYTRRKYVIFIMPPYTVHGKHKHFVNIMYYIFNARATIKQQLLGHCL